jgi:hypothetical protein
MIHHYVLSIARAGTAKAEWAVRLAPCSPLAASCSPDPKLETIL